VRDPRYLLLAAVLVAVCTPPAFAKTDTASRAGVTASLSYQESGIGFRNVRIRVQRQGAQLVNERGPRFSRCSVACEFWPANARAGESSIFVRNLDLDPELEVLAEFFTRGANCCLASRIYDFDPLRNTYARLDREWETRAHRGALDLDRDGSAEFVSADARFAGRYGCVACTPQPVRVFQLRDGGLRDVTRSFPGQVKSDLRDLIRLYRRARNEPLAARGVLAALTAERYLLDRGRVARRGLERSLARGELRGVRADGSPSGRAYVRSLLRFLLRAGYRR